MQKKEQLQIERIKSHDGNQVLKEIYGEFRNEFISWSVRGFSCTQDEAKDVFQMVVTIFYENVVSGKMTQLTSSLKTYLFSIGKNRLHRQYRQKTNRPETTFEDFYFDESIMGSEDFFYEELDDEYENKLNNVQKGLEKLGDPCRKILVQYYYEQKNVDEIVAEMKYKNSDTLKNLKYKCLKRLRKLVMISMF